MEIIFGVAILCIAIIGMSIGIIFNRRPLSGSCGGLSSDGNCSICGNSPEKCENQDLESSVIWMAKLDQL